MGIPRTIPVRVVRREDEERLADRARTGGQENAEPGELERRTGSEAPATTGDTQRATLPSGRTAELLTTGRQTAEAVAPKRTEAEPTGRRTAEESLEAADEWRDRALRMQADMENYRKRQQRLAQNEIESERQRMLLSFLRVVDDLERALAAPWGNEEGLRRGVGLTHQAALHLLEREGAEQIEAEGRPFDPHWHEAIATVDRRSAHAVPNAVVEVMEAGYRVDGRVLRPAKVVVAV